MAELHLMSKSDGDIKTHVVFIHGLGGHYKNTWTSSTPEKVFWPSWLCMDIENIAIWSVGYLNPMSMWGNQRTMHFTDRAKDILHCLNQEALLRNGSVVLIGHSMGGLLIKQMFHYADRNSELNRIMDRVHKVCFLATPHRGSSGANIIDKLRIFAWPSVATASLLKNDPNLRELNEWYRAWVRHRDVDHLILMENQPCKRLLTIVTPDSADPGLNVEALLVDADHISITKLANKQSQIYHYIKNFIEKETKPPQILWLNAKYPEGNHGWQGYANWSNAPKGIQEVFIVDEAVRLFDISSGDKKGKSGLEIVQMLRDKLTVLGSSTRLVGLSGVGKTRLVQALFDNRVDGNALPTELVFYTDIGHAPNPSPRAVIEKLVAEMKRAIVIIDNCPPDLHRDLVPICTESISLLTIEYDIREDQPERTGVLSLEPASANLIISLLRARFTQLRNVDAERIAEFSGGNARIAIALASTVGQYERISHLKDDQLFKRLFHQRHQEEHSLVQAAQTLSIIYSFQYKDENDAYSQEIKFLSDLSSIPEKVLYESAQELKRRSLIQQRGVWMAVLPHPIANRLARVALQNIPTKQFELLFNETTNRRMLISASRRISYLDNCSEALEIVASWLKQNGTIKKLLEHDEMDVALTILTNVAPVAPQKTLEFLIKTADNDTNFLTRQNPDFSLLAELLRRLAYEPELFSQSVRLLIEIASTEEKNERYNSVLSELKSLFYLYLSGTNATKEQRLEIIIELLQSTSECKIDIGFELLDASLESSHFSSHHSFDFGSHSRDYGYHPSSNREITEWYKLFINYTVSIVIGNNQIRRKGSAILASHLASLLHHKEFWDILDNAIDVILSVGEWSEGWLKIGSYLKLNSDDLEQTEIDRVTAIINKLTPVSLDENIHMYLLANMNDFYHLDTIDNDGNCEHNGYEVAEGNTEKMGEDLSKAHYEYLLVKLPEILSSRGDCGRGYNFGVGCAKGVLEHSTFWEILLDNLSKISFEKQNINVLQGFISHLAKVKPEFANSLLDSLLLDSRGNKWFPLIQFKVTLDEKAVLRLISSVESRCSPIHFFKGLGYGRVHEVLSDTDLCRILSAINKQPDGIGVSIEILSMRFHRLKHEDVYLPTDEIKVFAQQTLSLVAFHEEDFNGHMDHALHNVVRVALSTSNNYDATKSILSRMIECTPYFFIRYRHQKTLEIIIESNPKAILDSLIDENENGIENTVMFFKKNRISSLSLEAITEWCGGNLAKRCKVIASVIRLYTKENGVCRPSKEILKVLDICPNPLDVLSETATSLVPSSWSGSLSEILEVRLNIYAELEEHPNFQVQQWAQSQKKHLYKQIKRERAREEERAHLSDERFE